MPSLSRSSLHLLYFEEGSSSYPMPQICTVYIQCSCLMNLTEWHWTPWTQIDSLENIQTFHTDHRGLRGGKHLLTLVLSYDLSKQKKAAQVKKAHQRRQMSKSCGDSRCANPKKKKRTDDDLAALEAQHMMKGEFKQRKRLTQRWKLVGNESHFCSCFFAWIHIFLEVLYLYYNCTSTFLHDWFLTWVTLTTLKKIK